MKLNRWIWGVVLFSMIRMSVAEEPVGIRETESPKGWIISTAHSVYQLAVAQDGIVIPVYYGPCGEASEVVTANVNVDPIVGSRYRELPFRGGWIDQTPAVEVVYQDGTRECDLVYQSFEIFELEGAPCLRLDLKDEAYSLVVSSYIRAIPELDILEKWIALKNESANPILIENAQSGSIWLAAGNYELSHLAGDWGQEFQLYRTPLTPGVKTIKTHDFMAHRNPPWFAVSPERSTSESFGRVWFGSLHWSGNWRLDLNETPSGNLQISGGINFWDTNWQLIPGEEFTTPKIVFGFAQDGMGGATHRLHEYIRQHVLRPAFRDKPRPVLYNSWYATTFHVNEKQQVALAKVAKELGVELFVIDDGWFHGRKDDWAGLGDWFVDREKFPNGLQPMIQSINELGLDFGLWVEPEMVNPNSDLYRAHPDWVLHYPQRIRHEMRHQLVLNLAREDVYQYLLDSLSRLLSENNIRFIKWDRNRPITEPGWPDAPLEEQREIRIRFTTNLYRLIEELEKRFPEVMFESCSGGGGRTDLGILSRMDQIWTSDNTNPTDRLKIQYGYSFGFPANLMVNWVTADDWYNLKPSLRFRFHSCMSGVLGVGTDLTKWSKEERREAAELIAQYKEIRPVVQKGVLYRLSSPFESQRVALQYVAPDGSEAVVFLYNLWTSVPDWSPFSSVNGYLPLRGLNPDARYEVSGDWKGNIRGDTLMGAGIPWFLNGAFNSAILRLKRLEQN